MSSMSGGFQTKGNAGESPSEAASRCRPRICAGIELTYSATNQRLLLPILRQGIHEFHSKIVLPFQGRNKIILFFKVYKSSSKRKAHIMKNHPGAALPPSNRQKESEFSGLPNPSFSQTVGSITTSPQGCQWCHKQYASKVNFI